MKKYCNAIIFLTLLTIINSESLLCEIENPKNREYCKTLIPAEKDGEKGNCCYISAKKDDETHTYCYTFMEDSIDAIKEEFESDGYNNVEVDCNINSNSNSYSYYLQINFLLLLLNLL